MPEADKLLKKIWEELDSSMHALDHGGNINMASLEQKVHNFCNELSNLPPALAKAYEPRLEQIIVHLTTITNQLNAKKIAVSDEIDTINKRQRAFNAYTTSNLNSNGG